MGDTPHVRGKREVSIEEWNSMPNIPFDWLWGGWEETTLSGLFLFLLWDTYYHYNCPKGGISISGLQLKKLCNPIRSIYHSSSSECVLLSYDSIRTGEAPISIPYEPMGWSTCLYSTHIYSIWTARVSTAGWEGGWISSLSGSRTCSKACHRGAWWAREMEMVENHEPWGTSILKLKIVTKKGHRFFPHARYRKCTPVDAWISLGSICYHSFPLAGKLGVRGIKERARVMHSRSLMPNLSHRSHVDETQMWR